MSQLSRMPLSPVFIWKGMLILEISDLYLLAVMIFTAALLYSSIGHGGASGYLASMALFGLTPAIMKPSALVLNILVSSIATVAYYRAGGFSWRIFWPFAVASIPFAWLGSTISIPDYAYKLILGVTLLFASYRLWIHKSDVTRVISVSPFLKLFTGALIGFISGLIGVGGGIFLSPLLLLAGWADPKKTAGVSAAFILVNSLSGLAGHFTVIENLPGEVWYLAVSAVVGGTIGSQLGSKRFSHKALRQMLAAVLVIAGFKLTMV